MPKIVQVLGPARSGTTVTHLMLANANNAFACGEVYAFFRPWRTYHFNTPCSCGQAYQNCIWRKFETVTENKFYFNLANKLEIEWIIDESKRLRWVLDSQKWAAKYNMDIYNIVMVKDPINLMYSYWKRNKSLELVSAAYVNYYKRFIKLGLPFVSLCFENLINNPRENIKKLCDLLGMNYFQGKERFWEKNHCHLFGNIGVRNQINEGKNLIEKQEDLPEEFLYIAKKELDKFYSDKHLMSIHRELLSHEISCVDSYDKNDFVDRNCRLPYWYYRDYLISLYRRRFPQKWDHLQ